MAIEYELRINGKKSPHLASLWLNKVFFEGAKGTKINDLKKYIAMASNLVKEIYPPNHS